LAASHYWHLTDIELEEAIMKWAGTASLIALAALGQAWAGSPLEDSGPVGLQKEEASIPFINLRSSILSWQADGEKGLWIQDQRKQWYYATTFGRCEGLEFASQLGFKVGTLNTLDKFSEIIVPNYGQCAIRSLVKSEAPPRKGGRYQPPGEGQ
jgi:Family of unknown function (DUF6491)